MDSIRTCIGCRAKGPKDSLFRIGRTKDGAIAFDPSGKGPGRGAYVCSSECFDKAMGAGRLSAALRARVDVDAASALIDDLRIAIGRPARP